MGRLTQTIVSWGYEIKSENLCNVIGDYTQDNIQSKDFPKEMRMNLTRIAEATGHIKMHVKETLSQSISMTDLSEIKNLQSQQAELYIGTVVENRGEKPLGPVDPATHRAGKRLHGHHRLEVSERELNSPRPHL